MRELGYKRVHGDYDFSREDEGWVPRKKLEEKTKAKNISLIRSFGEKGKRKSEGGLECGRVDLIEEGEFKLRES